MGRSDELLVRRAASGNEEAFAALVSRYTGTIWRVALHVTRNRADLDDVFQKTLMKIWQQLPGFRGNSGFRTWVTRIAVNCGIDCLRQRERQMIAASAGEALLALNDDPESLACASEAERRILRALREDLTPNERTAFALRHAEGIPIREISERMGISGTAVRQAIRRAMIKLQAALVSDEVSHASK